MTNSRDLVYLAADIAAAKMKQRMLSVFIASLLAGLFIGLGYLGYLHVARETNKYFASLVFGTGLVLIVIGGGELFTGNCLMTLGVFFRRFSYWRMTLYLLMVWIGNFIGATSLVVLLELGGADPSLGTMAVLVSEAKIGLSFSEAFFLGVLCNILVAMGVYMTYASGSVPGKILAAVLPVSLFVICGFEHCVANMFILPYGFIKSSDISFLSLLNNLIPVTLGNFVGGGIIIPGAYYLIYKR